MLASMVLSMTLAAPVPVAPPAPATTGPLPRLMEVKANADGKVMVTIVRTEMQKIQIGAGAAVPPGGNAPPPAVITREIPVQKMVTVELGEVKDLTITTADGKKVDVADAVKKLKDGAVVVVSGDGKPVNPNYLKLFKDDVLVLASPELIATPNVTMPGKPFPGGGVRPVPLPIQIQPAPGVLPVKPIQIQIQPGNIQVVPALPAVPAKPEPAPEK